MKKWNKIILFALILGLGYTAQAQKDIKITESTEKINDYDGNVLRTVINRADEKTISKEWKRKMKDYDASVNTKKNEIHATEVMISTISEFPIRVYAQVNEINETQIEFLVMFMNGDRSISSSPDISGFTAAKQIVKEFTNQVSKEATKGYNKTQINLLDDLQKQLKELKNNKKDAEKEIKKAKETIKEKEYELAENEKKREETLKKIEAQKQTVKNANKEMDQFK
jgi:phosphoenolpyruvate-protein kinase (PTS system EI component)